MKNLLLLIISLCGATAYAQFPVTQTLGSPTTIVKSKGAFQADSLFVNAVYPDTIKANTNPYLKNYPGGQIFTTSDNTVWYRNATATGWIKYSSGGAGITPIANGGTNSSTALNNNRVMKTSGGQIVESSAITPTRALISDGNGIPTHSNVTSPELIQLSGVTGNIQTALNNRYDSLRRLPGSVILEGRKDNIWYNTGVVDSTGGGGAFIPLAGTAGIPATGNIEINADIILNGAILKYDAALLSGYFGINAGLGNTGTNVNANNEAAAKNNTGSDVNANGYNAAQGNTGSNVNANGRNAVYDNTGGNVNANGNSAGQGNTGSNVNANGNQAGYGNTWSNVDLSGPFAQADANKQQVFNNGIANSRWDYNLITAGVVVQVPQISGIAAVIVAVPAASASTGTTGSIAYDTNYIYICIATNTWKRSPLTTW